MVLSKDLLSGFAFKKVCANLKLRKFYKFHPKTVGRTNTIINQSVNQKLSLFR